MQFWLFGALNINWFYFHISFNALKVGIIWNRIFVGVDESNTFPGNMWNNKTSDNQSVIYKHVNIYTMNLLWKTYLLVHRIKSSAEHRIRPCFFHTPNFYMDPFSHFRVFNAFRKASCSSDVRCYVITHLWRQSMPHLLKLRIRLRPFVFITHDSLRLYHIHWRKIT